MVAIFIFYIHIVGASVAFTKSFQKHGMTDGFMTLAFVAIIFSVGWTIAGFLVRFLAPEHVIHPWFDNDMLSLSIVTVLEAILYAVYFIDKKKKA